MKRSVLPRRLLYFENKARKNGHTLICGLDEAGRGPLAGPVVASAVILKKKRFEARIDDSKCLTERQRSRAFEEIIQSAFIGIGRVEPELIDRINIFQASRLAMERALADLGIEADFLLIDGHIPVQTPQKRQCIVHGDSRSLSIACASIVAKVTRDRLMEAYDRQYPNYGFRKHKGYATEQHLAALKIFGPSPIHRMSFRPVGLQ
ncbi:MAG: ribonuclease HII, partial [Candidatus Omnitrophota bacterium]